MTNPIRAVGQDERAAFEAHVHQTWRVPLGYLDWALSKNSRGEYKDARAADQFSGWQARAALAPAPAPTEQPVRVNADGTAYVAPRIDDPMDPAFLSWWVNHGQEISSRGTVAEAAWTAARALATHPQPATGGVDAKDAEIARLRAGLKWYADGEHYVLDGWDAPDEPGWLCPDEGEHPWMVEDGAVARAILIGAAMVNDGETICAMPHAEAARSVLSGSPAPCSKCGGTGVVDDGEIDCYEGGMPYENGPVKCVKDCPACKGATRSPAPEVAPVPVEGVPLTDRRRGEIAYQLTKRLVIDMPTARAEVDRLCLVILSAVADADKGDYDAICRLVLQMRTALSHGSDA